MGTELTGLWKGSGALPEESMSWEEGAFFPFLCCEDPGLEQVDGTQETEAVWPGPSQPEF